MTALEELVGSRLPAITLEAMNARAALQVRVDSKYVLDLDRLDAFVDAVRGRCEVLQIDGRRAQTYDTVYFDSAALTSYRDHLQRRRQTYKLRTRTYVGSGLQVFEVKMRDGRGHTVKEKVDHSDIPADVIGDDAERFYRRTIMKTYGFDVEHAVAPSLRNRYSRLTLASTSSAERTTVDFDLDVLRDDDVVGSMRRDVVLVETKSAHGSGAIDRILWRLGARPVRVSKYCIGIALLHPALAVNRYSRAMQRYFRPTAQRLEVTNRPPAPAPPQPLIGPPRAPRAIRPPRPPRPPRPLRR
jgi:VTC domain